ncbi:MAG TPA: prepilin-type N-terminal cleavage/methylation domain-containing protein [Candidatus Saccharimonadales bacterium]
MPKAEAGFTLLEVLLSVAIIALLTSISLPIYESFVRRNDLDLTAQGIVAMIRRAELYARSGYHDDSWGVAISAGTAIIFKGPSFISRNITYDETLIIPDTISPSGLVEMQFAKLTATPTPASVGSITLNSTTNDTRTITINGEGMVNY